MDKCEYCEIYDGESTSLTDENKPLLVKFFRTLMGRETELSVEIWDNEMFLYMSDDYNSEPIDKIKINYCPICGRKIGT